MSIKLQRSEMLNNNSVRQQARCLRDRISHCCFGTDNLKLTKTGPKPQNLQGCEMQMNRKNMKRLKTVTTLMHCNLSLAVLETLQEPLLCHRNSRLLQT